MREAMHKEALTGVYNHIVGRYDFQHWLLTASLSGHLGSEQKLVRSRSVYFDPKYPTPNIQMAG